eukprot:m.19061 g.19061  ORF g.19061 m.19061 type:complete len:812 (+) comp7973_c0_seq1:1238-3673(+)
MARLTGLIVFGLACSGVTGTNLPSLSDLASSVLQVDAYDGMGDLPVISNFHGSLGVKPQGQNISASVFAISQYTLPPFAGCGVDGTNNTCGGLLYNREPVLASTYQWNAYEITRTSKQMGTPSVQFTSHVRMEFEGNSVLWDVNIEPHRSKNAHNLEQAQASMGNVSFELPALLRQLKTQPWASSVPTDPSQFTRQLVSLGSDLGLLCTDTMSNATSLFLFLGDLQPDQWITPQNPAHPPTATFHLDMSTKHTVHVALVVGPVPGIVTAQAMKLRENHAVAWLAAETQWNERWLSAFDPDGTHYSGYLPLLALPAQERYPSLQETRQPAPPAFYNPDAHPSSASLSGAERAYYMACLTVIALERTNLPEVYHRVYLTAAGNLIAPNLAIGGTQQFFWDAALHGYLTALLDPIAMEKDLMAIAKFDFRTGNGITLDNVQTSAKGPTFYAFNSWAVFSQFSAYLRVTNDTALLGVSVEVPQLGQITVARYLDAIATDWQGYTLPNSSLADYGGDPDSFFECVPTYLHVVAALQANNVWMLQELADLQESQGNNTGATRLRSLASSIVTDLMNHLYQPGKGFFNCLMPNGTLVEMRHIVDFFSVALGLCGRRNATCELTSQQKLEMRSFVTSELLTASWFRALSPKTAKMPYIARPDHGTTGAYDAWVALALEAIGVLDGNATQTVQLFETIGNVNAKLGPFGQAHEVPQDATPPYTPHNLKSSFKTARGMTRYTADNGGSFVDLVVRGIFGYNPPMNWETPSNNNTLGLVASYLRDPNATAFTGALYNLRTPVGCVHLTASTSAKINVTACST